MEKEGEREETLLPKQEAKDMETEKEVVFSVLQKLMMNRER